ncbi:hypothetical protein Nepgr_018313 [Nepenthes gracilis]|uniref:Uncharacterized protein n=1 Tax=Nepenthes gracilis TaxID=150966 RepID=A0AAD3STU8_NEPGR|nr:hypothetical protein Nepgr_018313 [Nepenthes gracilis]
MKLPLAIVAAILNFFFNLTKPLSTNRSQSSFPPFSTLLNLRQKLPQSTIVKLSVAGRHLLNPVATAPSPVKQQPKLVGEKQNNP